MLNHLQNEFNNSQTANGAFAYASTKSEVLDLFALGGAFRNRSDQDVAQLFSKAFGESPLLAMKTLFYLRDVTEGQGERRFFRIAMKHLALHNKQAVIKNLHLIPEFGRWDDLLPLMDAGLKAEVSTLIANQLKADMVSDNPSLLGKWMPSENTSSPQTKRHAKTLRKNLGLESKEYRKMLSSLRAKLNILETKLSEKNYSDIDYSKLPSRAGLIYRGAFFRNDESNYKSFLDSLTKGEVTVNAKTLYPYDIINKAFTGFSGHNISSYSYGGYGKVLTREDIQLLDAQWKSLPDFIGENSENSIAVVDTSGSMSGEPINVAISLGIYLAERNKGVFHNHFLSFNTNPSLNKIVGSNIVEKARNLSNTDWGGSTNIEAVFNKILKTAIQNKVSQDEMIAKVYIISDMQFNQCVHGANANIFKTMESKFNLAGYKMPNLVFWNVNAFKSNTPFTMNEQGVQLVSGMSPSIFKQLMSNNSVTPYELMLEVVESDRYKEVTV